MTTSTQLRETADELAEADTDTPTDAAATRAWEALLRLAADQLDALAPGRMLDPNNDDHDALLAAFREVERAMAAVAGEEAATR